MSNIEVGEYIRTRNGLIFKATEYWLSELTEEIKENIKVHSKNIIDLIEVGDFVGNCEIQYIYKNEKGETLLDNDNVTLTEKDIKTIVTKEQFKEMEYKI